MGTHGSQKKAETRMNAGLRPDQEVKVRAKRASILALDLPDYRQWADAAGLSHQVFTDIATDGLTSAPRLPTDGSTRTSREP